MFYQRRIGRIFLRNFGCRDEERGGRIIGAGSRGNHGGRGRGIAGKRELSLIGGLRYFAFGHCGKGLLKWFTPTFESERFRLRLDLFPP